MFRTLDSTWDRSARRGWTTLASFTMQALAISLLLAVSIFWVGGPPQIRWLQLSTPAAFSPQPEVAQPARGHNVPVTHRDLQAIPLIAPPSIPLHINNDPDSGPSTAGVPGVPDVGINSGAGPGSSVLRGIETLPIVIPPRPVPSKPLLVSHLSEANVLKRVQPIYPPIARQARVQGTVELRAIISKTGTIENLLVVRGHPMLSEAAIEAVRQWRYRPYLLNNEPVEVETEITVNFVLGGG